MSQTEDGPQNTEDVEGHLRPDEASMFGEDHPGAVKPPRRTPDLDEADDDVEGHMQVQETGRPPHEMDRKRD